MEPMRPERPFHFIALIFIVFCSAALTLTAQQPPKKIVAQEKQTNATGQTQIARGRYLVEEVAKCGECHTPRDENGNSDSARWLQGATIWIQPVHPTQNWAEWAPRLAGLPGFSDAQAEQVLERGVGPNGAPIRPPMHIYHLKHADADAIIAYLRSLRDKTAQ